MTDKPHLEIERRWLLRHGPNSNDFNIFVTLIILQYYTPDGRYRVSYDIKNDRTVFTVTRKRKIDYGINEEIEDVITEEQFNIAIKSATSSIAKARRQFEINGLIYEFDGLCLDGKSADPTLWILEIELNDINQPIAMPDAVKALIIKEITGDDAFSNYALSIKIEA